MNYPQTIILKTKADEIKAIYSIEERPGDILLEVVIREAKESRTAAQNRLLWDWHTEAGKEMGLSKDDVHETIFKPKFVLSILIRDDPFWAGMVADFAELRAEGKSAAADKIAKKIVRLCSSKKLNVTQMTEALREYEVLLRTERVKLKCHESYDLAMGVKK